VRGEVIARGEGRFADAQGALLYNRRGPDRQPAIIVRARDTRDVQEVVRFAAANGLAVSPRGGGHNFSGIAIQEGILLDLGGFDHLEIDAKARTAIVGPALDNLTLARRFADQGLAFPLGHCGHVCLSGYLLGGGIGWNSERWGLGCHNVTGVDVVTADGALCHASATENPDLFWAVRGGGPAFFGVVVRYHLALHPLPRAITTANRFYPLSQARALQDWMVAAKRVLPDNLEFTALTLAAPPPLAVAGSHVLLATATVFAEDAAEAEAVLGRLGGMAPAGALHEEVVETSFADLYIPLDHALPQGKRYAVDCLWSGQPSAAFLDTFARQVAEAPSAGCLALTAVLPAPEGDGPPPPDTAFSMAGLGFGAIYAVWDDPAADAAHIAWLRRAADALAPETIGHYVGEADLARPGWLQKCYAPEAWARLARLRAEWDPQGVFRRPELAGPALATAI
jgi:FAD/FMN-containing dehydrogenase